MAAITAAASGDVIAVAAGSYHEHLIINPGAGAITLTITGAGAATTILDGDNNGRAMMLGSRATVTLSGFTIQNGNAASESAPKGGGILNFGVLTLGDSVVRDNTAATGGGIANTGSLTVRTSSISGNTASAGDGGGITNGGPLTVDTSTISGNTAGSAGSGGGLSTSVSANIAVAILNSTVAHNHAAGSGGGIAVFAGGNSTGVKGTILAANDAGNFTADISGNIASGGYNVVGVATAANGFQSGDQTGTSGSPLDAKLGVLADNGGPTQTHALYPDSPAVDQGPPVGLGCGSKDQRGTSRPQGSSCDVGAYELALTLTTTAGPVTGGPLTFHGTGFGTGMTFKINAVTVAPMMVSPDGTTFVAAVPPHATVGAVPLSLSTAGGRVLNTTFTYLPVVTGLSATGGPTSGGALVSVTGAGFAAGQTTVTFGNADAPVQGDVTPTRITILTPAGAGIADVHVTVSGFTATKAGAYLYGAASPAKPPAPPASPPAMAASPAPPHRPAASPTPNATPNITPPRR